MEDGGWRMETGDWRPENGRWIVEVVRVIKNEVQAPDTGTGSEQ